MPLPGSVSNGSWWAPSGPGLDYPNWSVRFQTRPSSRPARSWRVEPGPIPRNPRVSPDVATPVSSNLRFCISGFRFVVAFRYATDNRQILTLLYHGLLSMYWPPYWWKFKDPRALPHPENERHWSIYDCWSCILGNLGGDRLHTVINIILAAFITKRDCEMLPTPSWSEHQCSVNDDWSCIFSNMSGA